MYTRTAERIPWRHYLLAAAATAGFLALVAILENVLYLPNGRQPVVVMRMVAAGVAFWASWWVCVILVIALTHRFPVEPPRRVRHLAIHLFGIIGLQAVLAALDWALLELAHVSGRRGGHALRDILFGIAPSYSAIALILPVAVLHAMRYARQARERASLETELATARLEALQRSIQPHFLFNTLNAIAAVAETDATQARRLITALGDLLRKVLQHDAEQTVTLEEELAFLRQYLVIQQTRMAERLTVDWDVDPRAHGVRIPFLTLQPLVENAVEHGIARRRRGGVLHIHASLQENGLLIRIVDEGEAPILAHSRGTGVGLRVTHERLQYFYGDRYSLNVDTRSPTFQVTTLTIPLGVVDLRTVLHAGRA